LITLGKSKLKLLNISFLSIKFSKLLLMVKRYRRPSRRNGRYSKRRRVSRNTKMYVARSRINRFNKPHIFRRISWVENIQESGSNHYKGYYFQWDNILNKNELAVIYDQFKIFKIILRIEPCFNGFDIANSSSSCMENYIRICHDYDSTDTPLTSENEFLEYSNVKSYKPSNLIKVTLYPKCLQMTYSTAISTGYGLMKPRWFDINSGGTIKHYGIHVFFPTMGKAANTYLWRVYATYLFGCKNAR